MSRRRVLIVEGNAEILAAQAAVFARVGWEVHPASTLARGIELLETRPDYVVMDPDLPDGKGEAILRRIRAEELPARVVVVISTLEPRRLAELALLLPVALVQKPIDPDIVARLCEAAVGGAPGSSDGES